MALRDYPEVQAAFKKLAAEREEILEAVAPLRKEQSELQVQIEALVAKQREVSAKIKKIERPRLTEIDTKLSAMARATGGLALNS